MRADEAAPFHDREFDPDAVVWVRGVDYVAGWRDAEDAALELADTLRGLGVDTEKLRLRADSAPDGSGVVRMTCSAHLAREIAVLVGAAVGHRETER